MSKKTYDESLTPEMVRGLFEYNPTTGTLTRKITGRIVGARRTDGYLVARVDSKAYMVHVLAWAIVHGQWPDPKLHIDHINGLKDDNRLENLRLVSHTSNLWNAGYSPRKRVSHETLPRGVYIRDGKYVTQLYHAGVRYCLGSFTSLAEAVIAYANKVVELGLPLDTDRYLANA